MSRLLNAKSNQVMIYAYIGFVVCRDQHDTYENCKRTGTAGIRDPTACYQESKLLTQCIQKKATKLDPISIPIFNDLRECLFQNDSHLFNCKEEMNQLVESHVNPANYRQMLMMSTPAQKMQKKYNATMSYCTNDPN